MAASSTTRERQRFSGGDLLRGASHNSAGSYCRCSTPLANSVEFANLSANCGGGATAIAPYKRCPTQRRSTLSLSALSQSSNRSSFDGSDMSKCQVERPGHLGKIERFDEQTRVSDLPAAAASHEAPKLLRGGPPLPCRLFLQGAERSKLTLTLNDQFHGGCAESADQLVLEVCDAHVETQPFHLDASEMGAEAGPLETAPEVALLRGVTETRQPDVSPRRSEQIQESSYRLRTPDRHNRDALSAKIPTTALSEGFECDLIAGSFNEHDRTQVDARGQRVRCGIDWSIPIASRPFGIRQVKSLLLVHLRIFTAHTRRACGRFDPYLRR